MLKLNLFINKTCTKYHEEIWGSLQAKIFTIIHRENPENDSKIASLLNFNLTHMFAWWKYYD